MNRYLFVLLSFYAFILARAARDVARMRRQ